MRVIATLSLWVRAGLARRGGQALHVPPPFAHVASNRWRLQAAHPSTERRDGVRHDGPHEVPGQTWRESMINLRDPVEGYLVGGRGGPKLVGIDLTVDRSSRDLSAPDDKPPWIPVRNSGFDSPTASQSARVVQSEGQAWRRSSGASLVTMSRSGDSLATHRGKRAPHQCHFSPDR